MPNGQTPSVKDIFGVSTNPDKKSEQTEQDKPGEVITIGDQNVRVPSDTKAFENKNPVNLRPVGDSEGFQDFDSFDEGIEHARFEIEASEERGQTLKGFIFEQTPPTDDNDTEKFLENIANEIGVDKETPLSEIDEDRLLAAQAKYETGGEIITKESPGLKESETADTVEEAPDVESIFGVEVDRRTDQGGLVSQAKEFIGYDPDEFEEREGIDEEDRESGVSAFVSGDPYNAFLDDDLLESLETNIPKTGQMYGAGIKFIGEKTGSETLKSTGDDLQEWSKNYMKELSKRGEIPKQTKWKGWESFADPEFWARNVSGTLPSSITVSLPGYTAAGVATVATPGAPDEAVIGGLTTAALANTAFGTPFESAVEAGMARKEGASTEEANSIFLQNMAVLGPTNLAEGALVFSPVSGSGAKNLIKQGTKRVAGNAIQEAGQETAQGVISDAPIERLTEMAAHGGIMGLGMSGGSILFQKLRDVPSKTEQKLGDEANEELEQEKEEARQRFEEMDDEQKEKILDIHGDKESVVEITALEMLARRDDSVGEEVRSAYQGTVQNNAEEAEQELQSAIRNSLQESFSDEKVQQLLEEAPSGGAIQQEEATQQQTAQEETPDVQTGEGQVDFTEEARRQFLGEDQEDQQKEQINIPAEQEIKSGNISAKEAKKQREEIFSNLKEGDTLINSQGEEATVRFVRRDGTVRAEGPAIGGDGNIFEPNDLVLYDSVEKEVVESEQTTADQVLEEQDQQEQALSEARREPRSEFDELLMRMDEPRVETTDDFSDEDFEQVRFALGDGTIDAEPGKVNKRLLVEENDGGTFRVVKTSMKSGKTIEVVNDDIDSRDVANRIRQNRINEINEEAVREVNKRQIVENFDVTMEQAGELLERDISARRLQLGEDGLPVQEARERQGEPITDVVGEDQREQTTDVEAEVDQEEVGQGEPGLIENQAEQLEQEQSELPDLQEVDVGESATVSTEDAQNVNAEYVVVSADSINTSFDQGFASSLQPRDQAELADERSALRQQFFSQEKFDPNLLGQSPTPENGAPVVDAESSTPIAGHLRVDVLKELHRSDHPNSQRYMRYLMENSEQFGISKEAVSQTDNPVLVRVPTEASNQQKVTMADQSNESRTGDMDEAQRAVRDAKRIDISKARNVSVSDQMNVDVRNNEAFVNHLKSDIFSASEINSLTNEDGSLNPKGERKALDRLFAMAYNNNTKLVQIGVSRDLGDIGMKKIFSALKRVAPEFVGAKALTRNGNAYDRDITPEIIKAVDIYHQYQTNENLGDVTDLTQQQDIFGGADAPFDLSQFQKDVIAFIDKYGGGKTGSKKAVTGALEKYIEAWTSENPEQGALFADGSDQFPPKEVLFQNAVSDMEAEQGKDSMVFPSAMEEAEKRTVKYAREFDPQNEDQFVEEVRRGEEILMDLDSNMSVEEQNAELPGNLTVDMLSNYILHVDEGTREIFRQTHKGSLGNLEAREEETGTTELSDDLKQIANEAQQRVDEKADIDREALERQVDDEAMRIIDQMEKNGDLMRGQYSFAFEVINSAKQQGMDIGTDITREDIQTIIEKGQVGGGANAQAESSSGAYQVDTMNFEVLVKDLGIADEVQNETINDLREHYEKRKGEIDRMRRKGLGIRQVEALASGLDMAPSDFVQESQNRNLSPEEMYLLGSYIRATEIDIAELKDELALAREASEDPENDEQVQQLEDIIETKEIARQELIFKAWMPSGTRAGQSLRMRQEFMDARLGRFKRISKAQAQSPQIGLENFSNIKEADRVDLRAHADSQIKKIYNRSARRAGEPLFHERMKDDAEFHEAWLDLDPLDTNAVNEFMKEYMPRAFSDKMRTFWMTNVLAGTDTAFRNVIGSAGLTTLRKGGATMTGIPDAIAKFAGHPEYEGKSFVETILGVGKGEFNSQEEIREAVRNSDEFEGTEEELFEMAVFPTALQDAMEAAQNAWQHGLSLDLGQETDFWTAPPGADTAPEPFQPIVSLLGEKYHTPLYAMGFQDQLLRTLNSEMVRQREAVRQAWLKSDTKEEYYKNLTDFYEHPDTMDGDVLEQMNQAASEGVAQLQEGMFGKISERMNQFRNSFFEWADSLDREGHDFMKYIPAFAGSFFEFMRTMGSLARSSFLKGTPAGAIKGITDVVTTSKELQKTDLSDEKIRQLENKFGTARRLTAESALGSFGLGTALYLAFGVAGLSISGGGPDDFDDKKELMSETNWEPYSLGITSPFTGERIQVSYKQIPPFDLPLTFVGELSDEIKYGTAGQQTINQKIGQVADAMLATTGAMTDKSYSYGLKKIGGLLSGDPTLGSGPKAVYETIYSPAQGMIPWVGLNKDIATFWDPTIKKDPETFTDFITQAPLENIPGGRNLLEARRNQFGEIESYDQDLFGLGNFIAPRISMGEQNIDDFRENQSTNRTLKKAMDHLEQASSSDSKSVFSANLDQFDLSEYEKNYVMAEKMWDFMNDKRHEIETSLMNKEVKKARQARQWFKKLRNHDLYKNENTRQLLQEIIVGEKVGWYGTANEGAPSLRKGDRRLQFFGGQYLANRVYERIDRHSENPRKRALKLKQLKAYFKQKQWSDLPAEEADRRAKQLQQRLMKMDEERGNNVLIGLGQ